MWLLANGFPHDDWYTANSEDHSGPGEWREVKGHYVVTLHGGVDGNGILTPDIIETALEMDRNNEDVFGNLLQGGMPDGSTIPVYSLKQVTAGKHKQHINNFTRFAIVRTLKQARQKVSGYESIDRLVDREGKVTDSQVIAYAAGVEEAQKLIKSSRDRFKSGELGVSHPFNNDKFEPDKPQSRVLFLGGDDGGLLGNYLLRNSARFVWIAPEARAAIETKNVQILNSAITRALYAGEGFMCNGQLYAPVTARNVQLTTER